MFVSVITLARLSRACVLSRDHSFVKGRLTLWFSGHRVDGFDCLELADSHGAEGLDESRARLRSFPVDPSHESVPDVAEWVFRRECA